MNRLPSDSGSVYYPSPSTDDLTGKLGRYGQTARRYLQENRTDLFRQWQKSGYLQEFLLSLDARYETWKTKMVQHLKESEYTQTSSLMSKAHAYHIQTQADSFVLALLHEELLSL